MKRLSLIIAIFFLSLTFTLSSFAMAQKEDKKAIVLAQFGTSYPAALVSITDIQKQVQKAFPNVKVKMAFTSYIIRNVWHERQNDKKFLKENKDISEEIFHVAQSVGKVLSDPIPKGVVGSGIRIDPSIFQVIMISPGIAQELVVFILLPIALPFKGNFLTLIGGRGIGHGWCI